MRGCCWVTSTLMLLAFLVPANGRAVRDPVRYQLALTSPPTTHDPAKSFDTDSSTVIVQLFDPLFIRSPDGNVVPILAENYEVSTNRTEYRIHLRKDLQFHDGSPISPKDVVFSL